jgi:hypothetical protein
MASTVLRGKAITYGDDVNTDVIIPARYCTSFRAEELAPHCMQDLDPDFQRKRRPGDIIVAGSNFGCGSSRENAPWRSGGRDQLRHRQVVRPDLLSQQHQYRPAHPGIAGGAEAIADGHELRWILSRAESAT